MLASLVYRLSAGDLIALRLFSLTLGAGVTVALSYLISRRLLPAQPQVALGVMALVAFLPQHLHMLSAVNNDALAELLVGLTLFWLLRYLDGEDIPVWQLGLLVGLALLTKLTIYFLALLAPLVIWLRWRKTNAAPSSLLRSLAVYAAIALLPRRPLVAAQYKRLRLPRLCSAWPRMMLSSPISHARPNSSARRAAASTWRRCWARPTRVSGGSSAGWRCRSTMCWAAGFTAASRC